MSILCNVRKSRKIMFFCVGSGERVGGIKGSTITPGHPSLKTTGNLTALFLEKSQ